MRTSGKYLNKFRILFSSLYSYILKFSMDLKGTRNLPELIKSEKSELLLVSLTSYGRRVNKSVFYTIYSLFEQEKMPDKIVLWLDSDNWNENNIPKKIKSLTSKGLEIRFYDDIKSFKKLVPTLELYPDYIVVTVDDDVIYVKDFLKKLWDSYKKAPDKIHCTNGHYPIFSNEGKIEHYRNWKSATYPKKSDVRYLFPVGSGGILYPPKSLHPDVLRKDLFMKLCPQADDIWFWIMALKSGTSHEIANLKYPYYSSESLYNYFHKNASLNHSNVLENKNDVQMKAVVDYYNIKF